MSGEEERKKVGGGEATWLKNLWQSTVIFNFEQLQKMTCWGDDEPDPPSDRPKVRGCTDVFWLAIYVSFWFLMIMIAGFALAYGNPRRLVNGYDSFGNTCGAEYNEKIGNFSLTGLNMTNKKFLFFFNMANVRQSMDICVEKCPDRDLLTLDDLRSFYKETGSKLCRYDFDILGENKDPHGLNESLLVSSAYGPCPLLPVNKSWDFVEQVLGDLYATWHYILAMTFLALFLSLIVISLFYLFANIVSFIIMTVVCIASLVGCTTVWWTYYEIKVELDNTPSELLLEEAIQNERAFFIYGIISSVITAVILLLVCSMRRNLNFLADLFKEAAECLSALPSLYFQPILSFIQLLVFYWFWVLVVVCLATANYPGVKSVHPFSSDASPSLLATSPGHRLSPSDQDSILGLHPVSNISIARHKTFTLVQYADATWVRYMWWVYLISLVWTSEFILSCQQMVVAGAVARWYFNG
ncbi:hypothetical protein LSTR_LSTR013032 [Laodelphax striatellus]|uniref:Choline transporter-like protein n=1 Tax=Laodelphax striatellus TaxID=195883 RepID=A0A482WN65_LAOST|nr:hypothetical protein LSTR_LSTR013032 [Laodelphax striatellus]